MSKPTDIRLQDVSWSTTDIDYRVPIKFGGRVVVDVTLLDVTVDVETRDGRRGSGTGSMPMGNAWAWPSSEVSGDHTLCCHGGAGEEAGCGSWRLSRKLAIRWKSRMP